MNPDAKTRVRELLTSIQTGDSKPVAYIDPNRYIQHNLAVADGLAGFGEVLKALPPGSARARPVRVFQDGDFVVAHTEYDFFGPKIGFDVFRFENGLIVEHWDNLQPMPDQPNPSGRTMIDGATEVKDRDRTAANKALVGEFVEVVLAKGGFETMATYFDGDRYLQHNPMIPNNVSGLVKAFGEMAEQGIRLEGYKVRRVLGEGNFVLVMAEGRFGGKEVTFYDLFRVENGKIAEHWDVIEPLLPRAQWKNTNGKF